MKFRSGSEEKVYKFFKDKKVKVKYEPNKYSYEWFENKTYCPDFLLPNGTYIEVKGRLTIEMRKKHLFFRKCNPNIVIRFAFDNPNKKLNKGGTMTYAGWCDKHNFEYCKISEGIPKQWYNARRV